MNSRKLWPERSVGKETKEPSESVCKTILEKPLLRLGDGTHWSQALYPQRSRHYEHNVEYTSTEWTGVEKKLSHHIV